MALQITTVKSTLTFSVLEEIVSFTTGGLGHSFLLAHCDPASGLLIGTVFPLADDPELIEEQLFILVVPLENFQ